MLKKMLFIATALMMILTGLHADSALRIACDGPNEGATVYINGKYKGECPTDLFLSPGDKKLRVVKKVGNEYEKIFEKNFYLVDDSAKKIEVLLGFKCVVECIKKGKKQCWSYNLRIKTSKGLDCAHS